MDAELRQRIREARSVREKAKAKKHLRQHQQLALEHGFASPTIRDPRNSGDPRKHA